MTSSGAALDAAPPEEGKKSSTVTVVLALAANLAIAVAKTVASLLTGSASMTAEAAHSWADAGNEVFLVVADKRSRKPRDKNHPLGYGREAYVWSMFAAFGLFTAGAVVSIMHGIQGLIAPEPAQDFLIAYIVLGIAFVLEGVSFTQALREARSTAARYRRHTLDFVVRGSNPTLRAVFAEDAAALVGLLIAVAGIAAHQLTGSPVPDAIGSILVGLLLGVIAVVLIEQNRRFLVGQKPDDEIEQLAVEELLTHPEIERVTYLHLEFIGPGKLFLVAAVDMTGNQPEDEVAVALRRVEKEIEEKHLIEEAVLTLSTPDQPTLGSRSGAKSGSSRG
ncbi:cation diffusion facilitator family transporter [Paenarthrobacter sp. DKR-5]|uniref:cation diffusion facilitator family transporter n=1 Tax=Paenarthrobacter sp. DKR-5 TaxID=2835535 RepID=UPI001BDCB0A1|nr:cation diffusion facilitator family transporter [Paenarthrobacter sp. DKR-5]MBT1002601.1 cation diffusion facilitator family transporter [Paenarthrobacter sp. DKR-5]